TAQLSSEKIAAGELFRRPVRRERFLPGGLFMGNLLQKIHAESVKKSIAFPLFKTAVLWYTTVVIWERRLERAFLPSYG
ncbi:MAG: hypothetical protein Q4C35_09165, partial [Eubacteriales bacterium]|nr:hypothetical protein [Eubacteriales bacterium]